MGLLSSIGTWVASNMPGVAKTVKKAAKIVYKGAEYVEKLFEGRNLVDEDMNEKVKKKKHTRPNFIDETEDDDNNGFFSTLSKEIDKSKKRLQKVEKENISDHQKIKLQIDIMELIIAAQTVERFTNNINLHAANLQIHLQTIQNTSGIIDDVNRQRVAIKALMQTVNHLINVTKNTDKVKPIEGIDINARQGSISIYGAYKAFQNTKKLLIDEVNNYEEALDDHKNRIENIRASARKSPTMAKRINTWLEESIEPSLQSAKSEAGKLKGELLVMPALEANLKRELKEAYRET